VAYLWSRTVPCPNCGAQMPLIRQYWLARKDKKKIALEPVLDHGSKRVDFKIVEGLNVAGDPGEATTSRGDTVCLLCRQVVKAENVRQAGRDGEMGAMLTSVVLQAKGREGKSFRADRLSDLKVYEAATEQLRGLETRDVRDLPIVPDEPIAPETLPIKILAMYLTMSQSCIVITWICQRSTNGSRNAAL
jgi:putative DNA methylase